MSKITYFLSASRSAGGEPFEGKFASESATADCSDKNSTPLTSLAGLYWFVEAPRYEDRATARAGLHVLSTEETAILMDRGHQVTAIDGPFRTREEAEESFERYWEMILDHDDD